MKQRPTTATELHTGSWWLVVTLVVCCLGSPRQTWLKILGFNYMDNKLLVIERSARIPQEENLGITIIHHSLFAKGVSFLWTYHSDKMFLVSRMKHDLMTKLSLTEKKTFYFPFLKARGLLSKYWKGQICILITLHAVIGNYQKVFAKMKELLKQLELQNAPYPDYIFSYLEIFCL